RGHLRLPLARLSAPCFRLALQLLGPGLALADPGLPGADLRVLLTRLRVALALARHDGLTPSLVARVRGRRFVVPRGAALDDAQPGRAGQGIKTRRVRRRRSTASRKRSSAGRACRESWLTAHSGALGRRSRAIARAASASRDFRSSAASALRARVKSLGATA